MKFTILPLCLLILSVGCDEEQSVYPTPAGADSGEPHLSLTSQGKPLLSWLEASAKGQALKFAIFEDNQWSPPKLVAEGSDWFVNWADFPSVEAFSDDLYLAHWLVKKPGNAYSYDIAISQSADQGNTWSKPQSPHQDGVAAEHGFVSLFPWQDKAMALWLDGRNPKTGTALRSTIVAEPDQDPNDEHVVDLLVCDCCQTDVAITDAGPVAVYRNRTVDEIRDIYTIRKLASGWSEPYAIAKDTWHITGCPVNGPAIAAQGNKVAVAWYTEANGEPKVQLALSTNSGASFESPVIISTDAPIGRVDITFTPNGDLAIIWLRAQGSVAELSLTTYAKTGAPDGALGRVKVIARTSASRPSGFPQVVSFDNSLLFAWTDVTDDGQQVITSVVNQQINQ